MNCQKCGNPVHPNASFCEHCGTSLEQTAPVQPVTPDQIPTYDQGQTWTPAPAAPAKRENIFTGIVGALIGAVIGGAAIILCSQLGIVSAISGLIMAVCTLKGYELLGGKLSIKGIVISVLIMLVAPYVADLIDWAIVIMNAYADYDITLGEAVALVPVLLEDGSIDSELYWQNLLMIYGFTALGAVGTVIGAVKDNKK